MSTGNFSKDFNRKNVVVETASADDAEAICDIRDRAWLETYPNDELGITVNDVRLMAQGPNGEYVPRRIAYLRETLAKTDAAETIFVAKIDGTVIGYIVPRIDERNRRCVGAIYVTPEAQGKGIGSKLMEKLLEWHGRDHAIYLEVVSYNYQAINFYKRFGFVPTEAIVPP